MSGLGNLFSGVSADSNDALKYSAPKEPKQRAPKPSTSPVPDRVAPVVASTPAVSAPAPKAAGPSKIMASAAVRLYKVNPSTGAYDALEGGGLLGCVMMGTGLTFQILIYNGQKVPQATVSVGATFDYALRDLYMSFADSTGNQWSLLFDSAEVMTVFVRTVAATVVHVASHSDAASQAVVRRSLPRTQAADDDGSTLALGMSAGVYLTAWELQEVADYPGDIVSGAPLKRVQPPDEVVKVKLSATEELIGGLSEGLVGLKKGDRVVLGVSPKVFYRGSSEGPIDLTRRAFPGSWMFLEVEVSKIKSAEKKKDKKPFADEAAAPVPQAPAAQASPVQTNVQRLAQRTSSFDEHSSAGGGTEIAARMARLAAQSGGGGGSGGANMQLAGIMSNQQQRSPGSQHQHDSRDMQGGYNNSGNSGHNSNSSDNGDYNHNNQGQSSFSGNSNNNSNQYQQHNQHQQQGRGSHNNNNSNGGNYNNNYDGNNHGNSNNQGYSQQQENRVAVIEGQGARSYYDNDDAGMDNNNIHNNNFYGNNSHSQQQQQAYRNLNSGRPAAAAPAAVVVSAANEASLSQLHTSVGAVQQSMLQLHTKLDQVSTQVSSSIALQQQQALVATGPGAGVPAMGMAGMGMGNMGMNPYMQQVQYQQQLLAQQQQQQQQMMMGMGGMGMNMMPGNTALAMPGASAVAGTGAAAGGPASSMRLKTEDLVSTLQALLADYEKNSSGGGSGGKAAAEALAREAEAKDSVRALKGSVERLEEKNEALQARYDKLMTEKSDLMEKYMDQFQTGSAANGRVLQMQAELEPLKSANRDLQAQVDQLRAAVSNAGSSSKEKEQEQRTLIAELKDKALSLEMQLMEARQAADSSRSSSSSELTALQALSQQQAADLAALRAETAQLKAALQAAEEDKHQAVADSQAQAAAKESALRQELSAQHATALEACHSKIASLEASLATASASAQDSSATAALEGQVADLRAQLGQSQETAAALSQALDAVAAKATESNDMHAATVASLQRQLESAKLEAENATASAAAATAATGAGAGSGKADAEDLKAIMQEVYAKACEVFNPEAEDAATAQYSTQDIVKRLRAVLKKVTSERNA